MVDGAEDSSRRDDPVAEVLDLLVRSHDMPYIGEPISQLEHALQCAHLATQAGASDDVVAAALLHDIGHLCAPADAPRMEHLGVANHDRLGAEYLRRLGFAETVIDLVRGHVEAKRYLVTTRPAYAGALSPASRSTLVHQGGPMSAAEVARFESDPRADDKLRLRAWDDAAKEVGLTVPTAASYRSLLRAWTERR